MKSSLYRVLPGILVILSLISCNATPGPSRNPDFPRDKWVYLINDLSTSEKLDEAVRIVKIAGEHGLNGVVLAAHLDAISRWSEQRVENLKALKSLCDSIEIELIPQLFSVGYGGSVLGHNPNLACGIPFTDTPFLVQGKIAYPDRERMNLIKNPGFENLSSDKSPSDFKVLDVLDRTTFVDMVNFHVGNKSVRLENFTSNPHGHARIVQPLPRLKKKTEYEASIWIKTENLEPADSVRMQIYKSDMSGTLYSSFYLDKPESTQDWKKFSFHFYSGEQTSAILYVGTWGAKKGKIWLDDITVTEASAAQDVIIRSGTPLNVKNADTGFLYSENTDYEKVEGVKSFSEFKQTLEIKLTDNSRIEDGDKLLVSGYSAARFRKSNGSYQIGVCMSEPELYDYWENEIKILYPILEMKKAFLSMDEIRAGGTCEACVSRNLTMGEILGDCVTRQMNMLRELDKDMEIYIWSDMFDPNANARDNYFFAASTFAGSWEHVPKDLIMVCWIYQQRKKSLKFFSDLGFRTSGTPYYDRKSIKDTKDWYSDLANTEGSIGIMYTTWKNDYEYLVEYADYVTEQSSD